MTTRVVRTEALLSAPPERVWAVLADFDSYAQWNPLNTSGQGKAALGLRVPMSVFNPLQPDKPLRMKMTVTACEAGRYLAWVGKVPIIFRGEHAFRLTPERSGTRMVHTETITGLMTRQITEQVVAEKFVPAYEACNRALAGRLASATLDPT